MRLTITSRQRALLLFVSASGYTAWFSGLGDRTSAEELGPVAQPFVTVGERPDLPSVAAIIVRDPFAGKPLPGAASGANANANANAARNPVQPSSAVGSGDVVVPDIASRSGGASGEATLVLRATIVGPEPVAYVANGTAMDIVRVGDSLGERRVAKIDLRGIAFADGTRLDLPDAYVPPPEPARHRAANEDRISLAVLRRLLLPSHAQPLPDGRSDGNTPNPQMQATPLQTASASAFPTPAPLPTIDMRGLPVGVNPTADPNGPTPYPNPYPYAPPVRH
jgi:hypothetical protein